MQHWQLSRCDLRLLALAADPLPFLLACGVDPPAAYCGTHQLCVRRSDPIIGCIGYIALVWLLDCLVPCWYPGVWLTVVWAPMVLCGQGCIELSLQSALGGQQVWHLFEYMCAAL
jgi:hypothetical protein